MIKVLEPKTYTRRPQRSGRLFCMQRIIGTGRRK
jgi:hypothetical protein